MTLQTERSERRSPLRAPDPEGSYSPVAGASALPLLTTKLTLPVPSPNLLPRPRLTARLNPLPSTRLALLVAPVGSGKSSLVNQWCQQQPEGSVAWLSLDPEESEPARFLLYVSAALERVAPAAAGPVRVLLQMAERPSLEYALTLLLNGVAALEHPVTLVLDEYHQIEATTVHDLVSFLVEHLPPTLFLILATRSDPPLPLPRLRLRSQLIEIRTEGLRFTAEEATQFLNERMGLTLPPEVVERLTERTEGWIGALQLAALSLQGEVDAAGFLEAFSGSDRYLVDSLSEEVLRRQPPEVQAFLGQTAFLKRLCGPLCEAVTGVPGAQAMLEQLEAAGLFLIPLDRERRWYRYHQLFSGVLRARPPEAEPVAELHERAAIWYEAEGMMEEAIEHALAGEQFERAARVIEREYTSEWLPGERHTLKRWLRALPPALIETRPELSQALASLHLYDYQVTEAERILNKCRFEPQDERPATRDLQGKLLIVRAGTARLQGDTERAAVLSRQALDLLPTDKHNFRSPALLNLGMLQEARGELVAAGEAFAGAMRESQTSGPRNVWLRASYGYGHLREAQGALHEAARLYHEAIAYATEHNYSHTPAAALIYAGLGRVYYRWNDLATAAGYLADCLERSHSAFAEASPVHAVPCLFEMLQVRTAQRDTVAAAAIFDRLVHCAREMNLPWLDPLLALLRVRKQHAPPEVAAAWLAAFEARTAEEWLPPVAVPDPCIPDIRGLEIMTWAQLRLAQGEVVAVKVRLEQFLEGMVKQGRHGTALELRVLLARLQWEGQRREQAVVVLEPGLVLAEREGYVRAFVEAGPALTPVLRQAAAQGITPEYVGKLLAALGAREDGSGTPTGSRSLPPVEPLSRRELEVLRLLAAGLANAEIAAEFFISVGTVKRHLSNLYSKLGVTSRTSAVARAHDLGLL